MLVQFVAVLGLLSCEALLDLKHTTGVLSGCTFYSSPMRLEQILAG